MRVSNTGFIYLAVLLLSIELVHGYKQYCRCECNDKSLVKEIEKCGLCTKEFCIELDSKLCGDDDKSSEDTPDGTKIIISCFQIESFKDAFIIYSFGTLVLGLLGYGLYKMYII